MKTITKRRKIEHYQLISVGGTSAGYPKQVYEIMMKLNILFKSAEEVFHISGEKVLFEYFLWFQFDWSIILYLLWWDGFPIFVIFDDVWFNVITTIHQANAQWAIFSTIHKHNPQWAFYTTNQPHGQWDIVWIIQQTKCTVDYYQYNP